MIAQIYEVKQLQSLLGIRFYKDGEKGDYLFNQ